MKKLLSLGLVLMLIIMDGCNVKKDENLQPTEKSPFKLLTVSSVVSVNSSDAIMKKLQTRPALNAFGALRIQEATLTTFSDNSNLKLVSIPLVGKDGTLIAVYSVEDDKFFIGSHEKIGETNAKGEFTGVNYLKTVDRVLIAEKIKDNYPIGSALINNIPATVSNARVEGACYDCINSGYQKMKVQCEADMLCDITCTISPCFAVWAATALAGCTSGCCTGNPCKLFEL